MKSGEDLIATTKEVIDATSSQVIFDAGAAYPIIDHGSADETEVNLYGYYYLASQDKEHWHVGTSSYIQQTV